MGGGFRFHLLVSVSGAARAQGSNPYGDSYAIVVGINAYQSGALRLNFAVNDATSIQESLVRLGFSEVILLLDEEATGQAIRAAFGKLSRETREEDRVFVFFAGHGLTINLPGGGGEMGYLLPVEGDTERIVSTGIAMSEVRDLSLLLPAKHVFFAVATAYSGLMAARSVVVTQRPEAQVDVDHLTRGRVRQILTAGERDQPVLEEAGHGLFTRRLLEGLEGEADVSPRDGILTAEELAAFVQGRVIASSSNRQTPFFGTMDGVGQFVFSVPEPGEGRPQADASDRDRVGHLADLLQNGSITGREYEEAKRVLEGEFQADRERGLLPIVRELADGRLAPPVYRLARDGVIGGQSVGESRPPERQEDRRLHSLLAHRRTLSFHAVATRHPPGTTPMRRLTRS